MAKKSGGGSVVLIVFLLFFILLSIGLGVATYMGFSQDDTVAKERDKLKKDVKQAQDDTEWYKFQANLFRSYMGQGQNLNLDELGLQREKFDKGTLAGKEKDELKLLLANVLDKKMMWDPAQKRPKTNYEALLADEVKKREVAEGVALSLQTEQLDPQKKNVAERDAQLAALKAKHAEEYTALQKRSEADRTKDLARISALEAEKETLSTKLAAQAMASEEDKRLIAKSLKEKDDLVAAVRKQLAQKEIKLEEITRSIGRETTLAPRTDWQITHVDSKSEMVYINLGSADKVRTQLTFRVYGMGPDGRPLGKDKALLEVTNVLKEHLSQAKLIYVTTPREKPRHDPVRDPVVKGDVLINPSWNPSQPRHIALAGVVDLTGSGRDESEQFIRALEKQNVIVDAYVDLKKDFTIKGPGINVQTDYLIVGDEPREVLGTAPGRDAEIKTKIKSAMETMEKQAKDNGIRRRGLRQYLEEIGYRLPPNVDENRKPVLDYKADPGAVKEPLKKEDPPAPAPAPAPAPDK